MILEAMERRYSGEGPYFDELRVGDVYENAPGITLTSGRAGAHQSIFGGRLRLSLDSHLSRQVSGVELADPAFVWDVAIGQSTLFTRRVIANLFYRGLAFHRIPEIGDTLRTRSEVVGLRQNATRPSGLAALRITTVDQHGRLVLDFWRCAMLPLSSPDVQTGNADDLSDIGHEPDMSQFAADVSAWNLDHLSPTPARAGDQWQLEAGDVVTSAPELARLSLNIAHVHHDRFLQSAGRLVYGGQTIGLALSQITRTLPDLVTVAGWYSCDHTGPVREGDTLVSTITVERVRIASSSGLRVLDLRSQVFAKRESNGSDQVLDWRLAVLAN